MKRPNKRLTSSLPIILLLFASICVFSYVKTYYVRTLITEEYTMKLVRNYDGETLNRFIQETSFSNKSNATDNRKIIRYECVKYPCGGLGDRLKGIVNGFVWAWLTERKFEIDIKYPCPLRYTYDTNEIDWFKSDSSMQLESLENKSIRRLDQFQGHELRNQMKNLDLLNFHADIDVIVLKTNLDWLLYLSENAKVRDRIIELGYKPHQFRTPYLFHMIYNTLFKLQPNLEKRYIEFMEQAKPNNNTKLICAQYRVVYSQSRNTEVFWDFIRDNFIKTLPDDNYKVFITTDEQFVESEAVRYFGKKYVVKTEGAFANIDYTNQVKDDCRRIQKPIIDFHILQNCDMALISESGFGKLGVWNRKDPAKDLYLFRPRKNGVPKFVKFEMDDPTAIL